MGLSGSAQAEGKFNEMLETLGSLVGFKCKRVPNDRKAVSAEQ